MKKIINVKGMSCKHCVNRIQDGFLALDGVKKAKVNLKKQQVAVALIKDVNNSIFVDKLADMGYEVGEIIDK